MRYCKEAQRRERQLRWLLNKSEKKQGIVVSGREESREQEAPSSVNKLPVDK